MIRIAFRSGMSRTNDFKAATAAGAAVGVVAGELHLMTEMFGIPKYLAKGGAVFVDSGAFTAFKTGEPLDFERVLRTYHTIASHARDMKADLKNLYVVSPDAVGDQHKTLALIAQYKPSLLKLIKRGCSLVVPLQCGEIPANDMLQTIKAILETDQFAAGVPSCAAAMSVNECATLDHHTFHILGRVKMNEEQAARIQALQAMQPDADITADANWMRSRIPEICQGTEKIRTERYLAGSQTLTMARTAALTAMLKADTTWHA